MKIIRISFEYIPDKMSIYLSFSRENPLEKLGGVDEVVNLRTKITQATAMYLLAHVHSKRGREVATVFTQASGILVMLGMAIPLAPINYQLLGLTDRSYMKEKGLEGVYDFVMGPEDKRIFNREQCKNILMLFRRIRPFLADTAKDMMEYSEEGRFFFLEGLFSKALETKQKVHLHCIED